MDQESILKAAPFLKKRLFFHETVDSTNIQARALLQLGISDGVIIAAAQTAGKGRLNRSFYSPANGIYLSMILPLCNAAPFATIRAASGICRALTEITAHPIAIKWVNDLLLNGYKVVGILAETAKNHIVLGIGINVNNPPEDFLPALPHVSSLSAQCQITFPLEEVIAKVVLAVDAVWTEDEGSVMTYYRKHLISLGRHVTVIQDQSERKGVATDLMSDGTLMVLFDDSGQVEPVISGDVSLRGLQGYF